LFLQGKGSITSHAMRASLISPNIRSRVGWADGANYNNTQLCMCCDCLIEVRGIGSCFNEAPGFLLFSASS